MPALLLLLAAVAMAEEEAERPKEMIKLVSKEGHEFSVEKQAAMVSNTIKSMLTGPGMFTENESDTINFPEISKEVLEEVSQRQSPLLPLPPPTCHSPLPATHFPLSAVRAMSGAAPVAAARQRIAACSPQRRRSRRQPVPVAMGRPAGALNLPRFHAPGDQVLLLQAALRQ